MQHSLRQRFRGVLLGAALGETLGLGCHEALAAKSAVSWLAIQQWKFSVSALSQPGWSQIALSQSAGLSQGQGQGQGQPEIGELPLPPAHPVAAAGLAIATLPIALSYHEDWYQLQHRLEQTASAWQLSLPLSSVLTVAYTISLALRERLHLDTLIPRLITDLELYDRDPLLMQHLNQVQTWVQQRAGVAMTRPQIQAIPPAAATAVAVALYGFLSTPADFQLSLLRTAQMRYQPQIACAIVAALSGAYNSLAGIPVQWRRAFNATASLSSQFVSSQFASLNWEAELLQQADLLWAAWSGADNPADWLQHSLYPTIASPHLIRPRL